MEGEGKKKGERVNSEREAGVDKRLCGSILNTLCRYPAPQEGGAGIPSCLECELH